MSHIVQIQTEVRDAAAVIAACSRLKLPEPKQGVFQLFGAAATGLGVELPSWRYPVVCDLTSGQLQYDNFSGRWGEQCELDRLLQMYSVEKTRLEARKKGYSVTEQALADGSIKLSLQVGAAV
ncbi:DUF1257 domain-containing protein [Lignipirellula cremea]|uniref:DUF1257 domain-containing protein n=1 Tax=Lignipirellula cremea TaxID=2528010 RepID=A0A518DKI0_9BACT|nr:DUF1257 domain-containing protein [Lignipirellula cremea]QDU92342.1 hypothetical protein Pla8534_00870 [Lignipirellula cremea]